MEATYSVHITGIKDGITIDEASGSLSRLFNISQQRAASILSAGRFPVKTGIDLKTSVKYEEALDKCGVTCVVEPEAAKPNSPPPCQPSVPGSSEKDVAQDEPAKNRIKHWAEWLRTAASRAQHFKLAAASVMVVILAAALTMKSCNSVTNDGHTEGSTSLSKLDIASMVGKSTRADIEAFQEAGGVQNRLESVWRGYLATSFRAVYDEQSTLLSMITIGLWGGDGQSHRTASLDSLKKTLADDCGKNWMRGDTPESKNIHVASKYPMTCSIEIRNQSADGILVTLSIDTKTLKAAEQMDVSTPDMGEEEFAECVEKKSAMLLNDLGVKNKDIPDEFMDEIEKECRKTWGAEEAVATRKIR